MGWEILINMNQICKSDPRYREVQEARLRGVLNVLGNSYANRKHSFLWAMLVYAVIWLALSPIQGAKAASLYSIVAALFWAFTHRVRRI